MRIGDWKGGGIESGPTRQSGSLFGVCIAAKPHIALGPCLVQWLIETHAPERTVNRRAANLSSFHKPDSHLLGAWSAGMVSAFASFWRNQRCL